MGSEQAPAEHWEDRLARAEEFEEDVGPVFGERAQAFSPELMGLLQRLWEAGVARGIEEGREIGIRDGRASRADRELERGAQQGRRELGLRFTEVIRGRKVNDVMRMGRLDQEGGRLEAVLQPWVVEAFQKIVDAPSLEEARRALEGKGPPPSPGDEAADRVLEHLDEAGG